MTYCTFHLAGKLGVPVIHEPSCITIILFLPSIYLTLVPAIFQAWLSSPDSGSMLRLWKCQHWDLHTMQQEEVDGGNTSRML